MTGVKRSLRRGALLVGGVGLVLALLTLAVRALPAGAQSAGFECVDGQAGPFPCENIDLEGSMTLPELGSFSGNDVWGWTDPETDRQYAIVGTATGTGFVDVTEPSSPVMLGTLPRAGLGDSLYWSDIKTDGNYAFIVSEGTASGMQVFDLTRLRGLDGTPLPERFDEDAFYDGTSNTHNIWINEETDFAYLVGSNTCESASGEENEDGGLHMVDISDPLDPRFAGCALVPVDGDEETPPNNYVHDVECIVYDGPDTDYTGREICVGANEDAIVVYDVTDKDSPTVVSETTYPSAAYTHQGSLTPDRRWLLFGDELDEQEGTVENTTTYITEFSDLDNPGTPVAFAHETGSIDHNLYIRDDLIFETNYLAGQRILRYDDALLAAGRLEEVAFLDTIPGADAAEFGGVWSNYYFEDTNTLIASGTETGTHALFVMRPQLGEPGGGEDDEGGKGGGSGGGGSGGSGGKGDGGSGGRGSGDPPRCKGREVTITGTRGDDRIEGTRGSDVILARGGDDRIRARGGHDVVCAGGGADEVRGGPGGDRIRGSRGRDLLRGGRGGDRIDGGARRDTCRGGRGKNRTRSCER